jgi:hypothetical protein
VTAVNRNSAAQIALTCALVAASLWDFRIATVRVFDLLSLALICGFFVLARDVGRDWFWKRGYILPLVALVVLYAAIGYANFHHRSSFAIALLALVCLQVAGFSEASRLARVFRWVVYLNVAVLLVQYFAFHLFHLVFDPQRVFGEESRIFVESPGGRYLRPAGFFQEPNSYALNMFLITIAALAPKRDRILALVAAGSMLITESMWAVVAAFVLVALNEWNSSETFVRKTAITLALWATMFACFNGYLWALKPAGATLPPLYARVSNLATDGSPRDRYGALVDRTPNLLCPQCRLKSGAFNLPKSVGMGLSTAAFYSAVPANGFSFIWYCMGPVGLVLLIATFLWSLYGATLQDILYVAAATVFAFTTYPTVTYVIFWLWLAAVVMMVRQRSDDARVLPSTSGGQT